MYEDAPRHKFFSGILRAASQHLNIKLEFVEKKPIESIAGKIRHFYDVYFLLNDAECVAFVKSGAFKKQFDAILEHDRQLFDEPNGVERKSNC